MAKRLEGKPFHLIASYCQSGTKADTLAYLRNSGLSQFTPNLTVAKQARHPDVKGNGYVPYGIVFDHTGKLVYHHMSGSYHGGDGWRMVELAEELVEKAPVIYLGQDPFRKVDALAQQIAKGKGLAGSIKKIEAQRAAAADDETRAELDRLQDIVTRHRDRGIQSALAKQGTQPSEVVPSLKALAKEFKGTALVAEVEAKLAEMNASDELKRAVAIEKSFRKVQKSWNKLKEKKRTETAQKRAVKKLEKLIEGNEDLPICKTIEEFLADLR